MKTAKKILFIINPISGTKDKRSLVDIIHKTLDSTDYAYEIKYTSGPTHATDIAEQASKNNFDIVVAVGGNGTVNETATGLIHTNTTLGIIPTGNGNGLSRHLGIPNDFQSALNLILEGVSIKIDACSANNIPFYNVAGIGYNAKIVHVSAKESVRDSFVYLYHYIKQWFFYKPKKYKLTTSSESIKKKALFISFANGSQFGNNAFIAPNAKVNDGKMDICIIEKFPNTALPSIILKLFNKSINNSPYSNVFQVDEIVVKQKSKKIHLDGEAFKLGKKIHFKVLPSALNILAPKVFIDGHNT